MKFVRRNQKELFFCYPRVSSSIKIELQYTYSIGLLYSVLIGSWPTVISSVFTNGTLEEKDLACFYSVGKVHITC